jgi:hypothetical protein
MGQESSAAEHDRLVKFLSLDGETYPHECDAMLFANMQDFRQHLPEPGRSLPELQQDILSETPHARGP